jgi:acyl carrier protein
MKDEIRKFVIAALEEMNYDVSGVDDDTAMGSAGVDLESLAIAELGVRIEDRYGVKFEDDEVEMVASMTIGEFVDLVAARAKAPAGAE